MYKTIFHLNKYFSINSPFSSKNFLSKAGTGDLVTALQKHFATYVPICFSVTEKPTKNMIDTSSAYLLIKPLEVFICNSIETTSVIDKIKELDDPPKLCGKVFKAGEPSYLCRLEKTSKFFGTKNF